MKPQAVLGIGAIGLVVLLGLCLAVAQPPGSALTWLLGTGAFSLATLLAGLLLARAADKRRAALTGAVLKTLDGAPLNQEAIKSCGELGEAVGRLAQELRHQKGLFQGLIGGLPMPFLLVDIKERVQHTNRQTMEMLQIDKEPESQNGRTLAEVFYNDSSRKTVVGKALATGEVFSNKEVTITGHKGGQRHVLYNVFPLYDLDHASIGGCCIYLDMTAVKEKEQEICDQNAIIGEAADRASAVADNLAASSGQLAAQVEQTRATAEALQARTDEVASAIEQMSRSIMEVAGNARSVTDLAESSRAKVGDGADEVERTRKVILTVRDEAQTLMSDMEHLGEHAERIGGVLNVITDIADQTNLLALNAAIEAARAGEAGRGFAVVADEVRKLAEKTMQATKEVGSVVQAIQESARKSRVSTETAVSSVMEGVESASSAGDKIREILTFIEQTTERVHGIADAVEQQSQAGDQVAGAASHIQNAAQETTTAMEEAARDVSGLARMAAELKTVIGDMRTRSNLECA
ncbi:MAG: PAS domain-containing protein [Desulfovibrionaceae bacterium]|jgi:methyl-accepting chemotaxis protein|nr:PAS domain-containing protein [Desulfovibrionaceae bacterium]